jgi:translocation and assembly module TamA
VTDLATDVWRWILLSCLASSALGGCAHETAQGRRWIHRVELRGNRHFSAGTIKQGLALQKSGWWPFGHKHYLNVGTRERDRKRLVAFYEQRGYFDARVVHDEARPRGKDAVDISITIDEGAPTRITEVKVNGLAALPEKLARRLRAKLPLKAGKVFDHDAFTAAQTFLLTELRAHGHAYAKVEGKALVNRPEHTATIELQAIPGPLVRIGAIRVQGNDKIPAHAIQHRATFSPGDVYRPQELERSETLIYGLGVFSSVALKLPEAPTPIADVTVQVAPARRLRELRLGGGLGIESQREEVRLRADWTLRNFFGGLRTLKLSLKPAYVVVPTITDIKRHGPAVRSEAQLIQPDLFSSRFSVQGRVGFDLGIHEGYQYYGPLGEVGVERSFLGNRLLLSASWNIQYLRFFNIDAEAFNPLTTPLGFGFTNPYRLAYLHESAELDLRDNRTEPRSGAYSAVHLEQGLPEVGGAFRYFKLAPEVRGYVPLGSRLVLGMRAHFGWLAPWTSRATDSPVTRRYYLGGPAAMRGFTYGRLAPQVVDPVKGSRIPVGGDGELLLTGELRISLFRLWGNWLGLVLFVDAGDVTPSVTQLQPKLHVAVGPDLLYQTPIGAIRLGVGVRLNRKGEWAPGGPGNGLQNPDPGSWGAFHITIGEAF